MLALGLEGLCAAGGDPCGDGNEIIAGLGVLLWLLLAGVDAGVGEGVDWGAEGLGTPPLAGVGSGVSGADGTGTPPASTTCRDTNLS